MTHPKQTISPGSAALDGGKKSMRLPGINTILRRLLPLVCIGVLGNLAFSWYTTDQGKLMNWSGFSPRYLMLAAVLALFPWFWHSIRLSIWSRFFGVRISRLNLLRIAVATDVGSVVAPVVVGGTPFKMGMLIQQGLQPGHAATVTLLGQLEEAVFFLSVIPVSLLLTKPWENPLWQRAGDFMNNHAISLLLGIGVVAGVAVFLKKSPFFRQFLRGRINRSEHWQTMIADFRDAIRLVYSSGRKSFLLSMLAITGQWLSRFSILVAILLALGLQVDYFTIFMLQWMVFVAMLVVPTPGGTGAAEGAFYLVFSTMIPRAAIGPVMTGWRLVLYYFMLLVGVVILFGTRKRSEAMALQLESECD